LFFIYSYTYHCAPPRVKVGGAAPDKKGFKEPALPWFADQILPFDITIAAANEYGTAASAKLFGVEILNEGFGTSIDDTVIEQQATFVAQTISPLQAVGTASMISGG
jgi:hypothetical protein